MGNTPLASQIVEDCDALRQFEAIIVDCRQFGEPIHVLNETLAEMFAYK